MKMIIIFNLGKILLFRRKAGTSFSEEKEAKDFLKRRKKQSQRTQSKSNMKADPLRLGSAFFFRKAAGASPRRVSFL
ncbi:MAG: hypothetical protein IJR89_05715 [Clostridia bacterium]|nr:hypothetical protein [Clostridia bacterium]